MMMGENIRIYRQKKHLTQEQLGEMIGVSAQAVSKWENDNALPDTALLPALADALDITLDSLFGRTASGEADTFRAIHRHHAAQKAMCFSTIWNLLYQSGIGCWNDFFTEPPALPDRRTRLQYAYDDGVPTCRLLNQPYEPNSSKTQYYVIDGFIVSPNVTVERIETINEGFVYSDHNPVVLEVSFGE